MAPMAETTSWATARQERRQDPTSLARPHILVLPIFVAFTDGSPDVAVAPSDAGMTGPPLCH
jgi:hypothetical protein